MTIQPKRSPELQEEAENLDREFLEAIASEETIYPWNSSAPEAESYFEQLEAQLALSDCFDSEEIATKADVFFAQLQQRWEIADQEHRSDYLD